MPTHIAGYDATSVTIRGKDLVADLMGKVSFTELMLLQLTGKMPTRAQSTILDAVLVTIMEHGLVPSAIVTRMTYYGAPESSQGAIVAGLLGVGDRFAGTASECSKLLEQIVQAAPADRSTVAVDAVKALRTLKKPIPGFGHPVHKDVDPRSAKLIEIVRRAQGEGAAGAGAGAADDAGTAGAAAGGDAGTAAATATATATVIPTPALTLAPTPTSGQYIAALETLEKAVELVIGKRIVTNVSAAIAVALCEAGVPSKASRGVVLTARCAGLAGHLLEESQEPAGEAMWNAVIEAVPYQP